MVRDPGAAARARRQEQKADAASGVVSIKVAGQDVGGGDGGSSGAGLGGGFKKGGFKKSGFKSAFVPVEGNAEDDGAGAEGAKEEEKVGLSPRTGASEFGESDTEDEGYEVYDPRRPTD